VLLSNKLLEIKNVTAYINQKRVFENLSINIELGCSTVILGPNGAGKSTLLKLLSREIFPVYKEDSCIKIFDKENWNIWDLRSKIGIVSNDLHQFIYGSAEGINVILSGLFASPDIWEYQKVTDKQIKNAEKILDYLDITRLRQREFECMSTGEQRRCLLGRALINDPDVLILDEPTSGLDVKACFQYVGIIRDLIQQGKTVILVTHHIHEIPPELNNVLLLKDGRILYSGSKKEILTNENITALYETPLKLVQTDGYFNILPG